MIVGILYICTGVYNIFWKDFYLSAKKYLFPNTKKIFYVFTDKNDIFGEKKNEDIVKTYIEHKEWPYNTLLRFKIFNDHSHLFKHCDYLFFYNANTFFLNDISTDEILPDKNSDYLVALSNNDICYPNKKIDEYPYERNPQSSAFIPYGKGTYYFRGGFNGGRTEEYLNLIKYCQNNTNADLKSNIIAKWQDESHLNKYLLDKNIKIVYTIYGKAEEWKNPKNAKIIFRDKGKIIGRKKINQFKNITNNYSLNRFLNKIRKRFLLWK
jgi:hypothetical protein